MWCELSIRSSVCPTCLSACCVFLLAFLLFPASVSPLPLSYWRDASLFVFLSSVFLFVLLYPNLFSTPGSKRMSHCAITALPIHASAFLHLSRSACVLPAHWVLPREAENSLLILYDPKSFFFSERPCFPYRCVSAHFPARLEGVWKLYVESPAIGITGITDKPFVPPLHVQES